MRPYTKWEWTLPSGVVVKEALQRAYSIMQSEPRGPVYLMMQRETLTEHWRVDQVHRYGGDRFGPLAGGGADPALIAALADRLLAAENPILITGYGGTDPLGAQKIDRARRIRRHPGVRGELEEQHLLRKPVLRRICARRACRKPMSACLVDVEVPWFPAEVQPNEKSFWAHIDVDVLKLGSPMWTFPGTPAHCRAIPAASSISCWPS